MLLGWKNQYCENDYTTKCNLQIQCDPYQITDGIIHKTAAAAAAAAAAVSNSVRDQLCATP